ncbi:hypothetical protein [Arthrobacter sp. KK5.5]|uniref:hypothetical protein n=1 Tax=Arthrobacter sp. KK5.5 TaxID=3373084 RepID=UPI003EE60F92
MPNHDPDPRRDPSSDDAAWRDLVRQLESTDPSAEQSAPSERPAPAVPAPRIADPAAPGPRDYSPPEPDDDDDAFVPEDPPALGSGNPMTVLAWCGAAGAPLALLLLAILWRGAPAVAWIGLCLAFLVAVGYLLWRLPRHRTGNDDGSRV